MTKQLQALRCLEYATSLGIQLLSELDRARAQVRSMSENDDGRSIVMPGNALGLNQAVEDAFKSCRLIGRSE